MVFWRLFFLAGTYKLYTKTHKALFCAIMYALTMLVNVLIFSLALHSTSVGAAAVHLLIDFLGAWGLLVLLERLEGTGAVYWGAFLIGAGLLAYL